MSNSADPKHLKHDSQTLELAELKTRLTMTYQERIEAHENARQLLEDLKKAGEQQRAKSERTP